MSAPPNAPTRSQSYGKWEISYNPPPIPMRNCDWQYCHKDFDGGEDAGDDRYGSAATLAEAMDDIDDREGEAFDERGCDRCSLGGSPVSCLAAGPCDWRDDERLRRAIRATGSAA